MLSKDGDKNLFWVWHGIKARCLNPNHSTFYRYGGRGISVCKQWLNDSKLFFDWALSNGWSKGLTVDRINNDGDYSPENCRIVSHAENCQNRSNNKLTLKKTTEMRRLNSEYGVTPSELGKMFGVTNATAGKVIHRKIWQEV